MTIDTERGFGSLDVARSRAEHGANVLPRAEVPPLAVLLAKELVEPLSIVLVVAATMTIAVLREYAEGIAITAIVVVDALIGATQRHRADRAMAALDELVPQTTTVRRDGGLRLVASTDVVVGDVVELASGDRVPADGRLVAAAALQVDESILTGESLPVSKAVVDGDEGTVGAGALIVAGRGTAVVTAVGAQSSVGEISAAMEEATTTPLGADMADTARWLAFGAGAVGLAFGAVSYVRSAGGRDAVIDAVLAGIALAVAAVPEGLPAVVSVALAVGAHRMARRGAIVRRLDAVETLGATDVLCTDKTGTLTTGRLTLLEARCADGCEEAFWAVAARCNDSRGDIGDAVDVVLADAARRRGGSLPSADRTLERPFDPVTRLQEVVHLEPTGPVLSVKGAPSAVLTRCAPGAVRDQLSAEAETIAARGHRVLALADARTAELGSHDLRPLGLAVFGDPLRPTTRAALAACRDGGVRVVLVTGDHPATALAVASDAGLTVRRTLTGEDLATTDDESTRADRLIEADVIARVTPTVKAELLAAHQHRGRVVAMTGDGVNDAPALRRAEIGVAVSTAAGTAVAREAADIVVTDGNLETIVAAVREGRRAFRNLAAVVSYLLAGNVAEVLVVAGAIPLLTELPVPLEPLHLLWINLVTDGLPAVALGTDEPAADPLDDPPRARSERLLSRDRLRAILARGSLLTVALMALAIAGVQAGVDDRVVRTQLVLGLVLGQLALPLVVRARRWAFEAGWSANHRLLGVLAGSLVVQVLVFATPSGRALLDLEALSGAQWAQTVAAVVGALVVMELLRLARHLRRRRRG